MANQIFDDNMLAIKKYVDTWYDYIKNEQYSLDPDVSISVHKSKKNQTIFRVEKGDRKLYVSGKYGTLEQVDKWIVNQDCDKYMAVIFIIGLGDAVSLMRMLEKLNDTVRIIVYEPCINIFIKCIEEVDLTTAFECKRVSFIVNGINGKELEKAFSLNIKTENITIVHGFVTANYEYLFPLETERALDDFKYFLAKTRTNINTEIYFTSVIGINTIENLQYLLDGYTLNGLYGVLPDTFPCIIVAAGPSLDKNIKELKNVKHRACIIACDTALKPLLDNGITPDIFLVVDPLKSIELFEREGIEYIPFVTPISAPNKVMKLHKGKKFFYLSEEPLMHCMLDQGLQFRTETITYKENISALGTGGSVATSAYCLAKYMGSKTIILIGQDLAMTGNKAHASNTFKTEANKTISEEELKSGKYVQVDGIDGEKVYTLLNLKQYLDWYEREIECDDTTHVIDATEGGALIKGTEIMTLSEAIMKKCHESIDFTNLIDDILPLFDDQGRTNIVSYFSKIKSYIKKTRNRIRRGKKLYSQLLKIDVEQDSEEKLLSLNKKIKENNQYLERDAIALTLLGCLERIQATMRLTMYDLTEDNQSEIETVAKQGILLLRRLEVLLDKMEPLFIRELSHLDNQNK